MKKTIKTIVWVGIFSIAMAYLESTIVVYLRHIYGINDLLRDLPTQPDKFTLIEIGRELCTLVMLAAIGWIAGNKWQDRIGFSLIAFGIWDIFYYIWLLVFIGWPTSILEWDILFLIPLPWWGPVLSPVLIATLMIAGGIIAVFKLQKNIVLKISLIDKGIIGFSLLLALYVFMKDAIHALPQGLKAVGYVRPETFNWPMFAVSILGMDFIIFKLSKTKI